MTDAIEHLAYADASESLRREIAELQERAYGTTGAARAGKLPLLHNPDLNAQSFMLRWNGKLVSYAGVLTTAIHHGGAAYRVSGLSCVATDPAFGRKGFATRVVSAATTFMAQSGVDLGVFTCAPGLVRLYSGAGNWEPQPNLELIGSRDPAALSSSSLGVVVLTRLFSDRASAHAAALREGTIDLQLPVGQFW